MIPYVPIAMTMATAPRRGGGRRHAPRDALGGGADRCEAGRGSMRHRRAVGLAWVVILLFAQGCFGASPPPPSTAGELPAGTAIRNAPTLTPTGMVRAGASAPGASPVASPAATEPRLGLDPPAAAPRSGSPRASAQPASPTARGQEATIGQVQGDGAFSPLLDRAVRVEGVVTADFQAVAAPARGFFVQEPSDAGNGARATPGRAGANRSTGIFVFQGERAAPEVRVGDLVSVVGAVREHNGRTEIDISLPVGALSVRSSGNPLPRPIELRPQPDEAQSRRYYEGLEGMLVSLPQSIAVGPTAASGEFSVVRADSGLTRVFAGDPRGAGARVAVDDEAGREARYEVTVGDRIDGIVGPLDYTAGGYRIQQLPEVRLLVRPADHPLPLVMPAGPGEFTVASFNLEDFFAPADGPDRAAPCDRVAGGEPCRGRLTASDYTLKLGKAALALRDAFGAPTLVAVQEVESLAVLNALVARPELTPFDYGAVLLEGPDPRGGNVGLLYRRDRVTIERATQRNACTTGAYGFADADARCASRGDGRLDGHLLAARPPLVVSLTVRDAAGAVEWPLTLIVGHFTARGGEPEAGASAARRAEEARLVAGLVNEIVAADPNAAALVLGDLNDTLASEPLRVLTTVAPLRPLTLDVPEPGRYSVILDGQSQALDHILVTANLRGALVGATFAHLNADYPAGRARDPSFFRVSDRDPAVARFRLAP